MATLRKSEIAEFIKEEFGLTSKKRAREGFDKLAEFIAANIVDGKDVVLPGIGKLKLGDFQARSYQSALTKGQIINKPAYKKIVLKAGRKLA